jgi:hypothetical protein
MAVMVAQDDHSARASAAFNPSRSSPLSARRLDHASRSPMVRHSRPHARSTAIVASLLLVALLPGGVIAAPPAAVNDEYTVGVNASETDLDVLVNDSDPDGDALRVVAVTAPAHGIATPSIDGSAVTYRPDTSFRGIDTFAYQVEDASLGRSLATVTVIVNDPPIAVDDPATTCQSRDLAGQPAFGGFALVIEDHVGPADPTDYRLSLCAPLVNDTDPNGDALTWEILTQPSHGDAINLDEIIVGYRPDPDFSTRPGNEAGGQWLSDSFTYRAFDGLSYSEPATMGFWVAPINDPPTFTPGADVWLFQDSGAYAATWATDISPGPANESDQTVRFELSSLVQFQPANLFVDSPAIDGNGVLTFSLAPGVNGFASVTFRAKDDGGTEPNYAQGTNSAPPDDTADDVTFHIFVLPDEVFANPDPVELPEDPDPASWPVAVLANDTVPPGSTIVAVTPGSLGAVTIAPDGRSVFYQPRPDANGSDTFTYTVSNGRGAEDTATVSVSILAVNDAPVAQDDSVTVPRHAPATVIDALANDTDVDGQTVTITGKTNASKGTVTITAGGTAVTYQPNPNAVGADSFSYTISDGQGGSDTATVVLTILKSKGPR